MRALVLSRALTAGRKALVPRIQCFATAPAQPDPAQSASEGDSDMVLDTFKEQQHQYRALLDGSKDLQAPLNGDEAAIRKYATEMEALRKKVGLPEHVETLEAVLEYKLQQAHGDVRSFLAATLEGQDFGDFEGAAAEVNAAVEAASKDGGLRTDSEQGWDVLEQKLGEIQKKHGLESYDKIKDKAILEMYTQQLSDLKAKVVEDMDNVKRRDHLDWVDVDTSTLRASAI